MSLPLPKINDIKDLVLRGDHTWQELWDRWANKVTHKLAMIELVKLAAALPHREGRELDEKAMGATYADTLVKDGVPYFALSAAVACFIRGHVPEQSKFFPSLPELLAECKRQFIGVIKVHKTYERPATAANARATMSHKLQDGEPYSPGEYFFAQHIKRRCNDNRAIMAIIIDARNRFWRRRDKGEELTYPDSLELDLWELTGDASLTMDRFRAARKHKPAWMDRRIKDNRAAFEEHRKLNPDANYIDFLAGLVKGAALEMGKSRDAVKRSAAKDFQQYVDAAERTRMQREADLRAAQERRAERGIE